MRLTGRRAGSAFSSDAENGRDSGTRQPGMPGASAMDAAKVAYHGRQIGRSDLYCRGRVSETRRDRRAASGGCCPTPASPPMSCSSAMRSGRPLSGRAALSRYAPLPANRALCGEPTGGGRSPVSNPMETTETTRRVSRRPPWRWPAPSCRVSPDSSSRSRRMPTCSASASRSLSDRCWWCQAG
jgi:hypothetical protein